MHQQYQIDIYIQHCSKLIFTLLSLTFLELRLSHIIWYSKELNILSYCRWYPVDINCAWAKQFKGYIIWLITKIDYHILPQYIRNHQSSKTSILRSVLNIRSMLKQYWRATNSHLSTIFLASALLINTSFYVYNFMFW